MKNFIVGCIVCLSFVAFGQPGQTPVKEVDGKRFYEHVVKPGNTLWGLQRVYGVPMEQIVQYNPEINTGLKDGQTVLIPVTKESLAKIPTKEYKVRRQETLYGISKKFNVSIDDLMGLNPELASGLKKGQIIKVPLNCDTEEHVDEVEEVSVPNPFVVDSVENEDGSIDQFSFSFSDSIVRHTVLSHETLYSISKRFMVPMKELIEKNGLQSSSIKEGQVLVIPVKTERIERVEIKPVPEDYDPFGSEELVFEKKEYNKVVVLLPFHLGDESKSAKYLSDVSVKFYMGVQLALEQLEKEGFNGDVVVLDTKSDSTRVHELLNSEKMLGADLVIGPLVKNNVSLVSNYCRENRIRMVSPVAVDENVISDNRLVYGAVQSSEVLIDRLAIYMSQLKGGNVVLVKPTKPEDLKLYERFKEVYGAQENPFKLKVQERTLDTFTPTITRSGKTYFVVPTNDRFTAIKFMNNLDRGAFRTKATNLYVFGTKEWNNFTDINNIYKNKYQLHFASPNFLDYYSDEMIEMNQLFREKFNTDFSKMSVHGYDVTINFVHSLLMQSEETPQLLMSRFDMQQDSNLDGFKNRSGFIVKQEDFELINSEADDKE